MRVRQSSRSRPARLGVPAEVTRAIPRWFGKLEEADQRTGVVTREMYDAVLPHMAPHARTAFVIGWHLGMRRGEILSMRWDQVDLRQSLIRLASDQTKGRKLRVAPIYGDMAAVLEMARASCPKGCPYVVQFEGRRIESVKTAWAAAFSRAGLLEERPRRSGKGTIMKPAAMFHDLRRTAATNMIRAGVPVPVILSVVGWKSDAMLRRYGILDEIDARQAAATMQAWDQAQRAQQAEPKPQTRTM